MPIKSLVRGLESIVGREWVFHAPEDLIVWEGDATIDRALPQAVVFPNTAQEVAAIVVLARRLGVPLVARGAGTGLSGGAIALEGALVVATTRMKRILEIDVANRLALVQPGLVNVELTQAVSPYGLYYAPDPSSQRACTLGGNVAENSGGPHCLAYGVTTNHVLGLEVVLANGDIVWLGGKSQDTPGYDLRGIVVGSEGTLAIVTQIVVRLLRQPETTVTLLAICDEVDQATQTVSAIVSAGIVPAALEMMDRNTMRAVEAAFGAGYPPDAGAVLLIEVDGLREAALEQAQTIEAICRQQGAREVRTATEAQERERLWAGRKGALAALGRLAPNYYILDGVVPRTKLPQVLRKVYEVCERYGFQVANVFHAGDGNLHPNILFDQDEPGATQRVLEVGGEIMRLCVEAGGSITGEHGIGLEKREYMSWIFSEDDLAAMQKVKATFMTHDLFNPGKAFPTHTGCGEVSSQQRAVRLVGPGAYV